MGQTLGTGVLGFKGKIYTPIAAVNEEIKCIGDIQIPRKATEIDVTSRENNGTKAWTRGLKEFGCTFTIQKRKGGTCYEAIRTAWQTDGATIDIIACDGVITAAGTEKLAMTMEVFDFSDGMPIEGIQTKNVVLRPSWYATSPPTESVV